jgi:hypothetical protein
VRGQARVGVGVLDHVSVGASFLAVLGGEAPNRVACCGNDSGNQAFSATAGLLSLRLHSTQAPPSWIPQYWVEAGLDDGPSPPRVGRVLDGAVTASHRAPVMT